MTRPRFSPTPDSGYFDGMAGHRNGFYRDVPQYESSRHFDARPFERHDPQYYSQRYAGDTGYGAGMRDTRSNVPPPHFHHSGYHSDDMHFRYENTPYHQQVRVPPSPPPPSNSSRVYYSDSDYVEPYRATATAFPPPPRHLARKEEHGRHHAVQPPPPPPLYVPQAQPKIVAPAEIRIRPPVVRTPVNASLESPRAEVIVPDVRGVGTLAHMFEKTARIVQKDIQSTPPKERREPNHKIYTCR